MFTSSRFFLLGSLLCLPGLAAPPQALASFDYVWQTIADKHYNPAELEKLPNGESWQKVRARLRPQVEAAETTDQVRAVLREMLKTLGKSHYAIAGPEFQPPGNRREGGPATPGFVVEMVEGKVLVTHVKPGSEAERAGLRLGWELVDVEGINVAKTITPPMRPIDRHRILKDQISGFHGEQLPFSFATPQGPRKILLQLPAPDGSTGFGYIQGVNVDREARLLGPRQDVAYFRLGMFLDAVRVLPEFEKFVLENASARGFVLDLRGNPGGIAIMANALSGWFLKDSGIKLGTMYQRQMTLEFVVIPRLQPFLGPLAILIDGASASTSEILAGGLQHLGRARLFGAPTAGAALPSVVLQK
ncbi:MAG: hypothetical protein OHK0021_15390 [Bryobacter sp.]